MMKRKYGWTLATLLAMAAVSAMAETFVLRDGTDIEGSVIRARNARVSIRTSTGVASYRVTQFDDTTREKHFPDLEDAPPPPATAGHLGEQDGRKARQTSAGRRNAALFPDDRLHYRRAHTRSHRLAVVHRGGLCEVALVGHRAATVQRRSGHSFPGVLLGGGQATISDVSRRHRPASGGSLRQAIVSCLSVREGIAP